MGTSKNRLLWNAMPAVVRADIEQLISGPVVVVNYYPELAARIPVREICRIAAGADGAILAAGANRRPARQKAFAELVQRWRHVARSDPLRAGHPPLCQLSRAARGL